MTMTEEKKTGNRFIEFLLEKLLSEKYRESFVGDLLESDEVRSTASRISAKMWLFFQLLSSFFSLLRKNIYGSVAMFRNYFLMAFRNLKKHRTYTLINVFGLALGLSATILILLYLQFEISYDRFHENAETIYRVCIRHLREGMSEGETHVYTPPIGPDMKKDFPEVEDFVRMSTLRVAYLNVDNRAFKVEDIRYASPGLFEVFSFKLKSGDPQKALADPFSIVLSERTAERIFGSKDPIGETIQIGAEDLYKITGIVENPPSNSSIQFNALISFETLYARPIMAMDWNGGNQIITYVKLGKNATTSSVEEKFPDFLWRNINQRIAQFGWKNEAYLQPLKKIHFYYDQSSRTALVNFYTFSAVAIFILFIACINFVNLTTARAARRAREVGIRKVIGAHRGNLIRQFLGESLVMTLLAFTVGIGVAFLLTPTYNQLLNKELNPFELLNFTSIFGLLFLILLVGFASGIHPAFYLSSFQPAKTLKGVFDSARGKKKFRNALVVFQFVISVTLIICTLLIRNQLSYIKKAELGYNKENMVIIPLADQDLRTKTEEMRGALLSLPGIVQAAASSDVPHNGFTSNGYIPEGYSHSIMIHALDADEHFLETYGIDMAMGRNFSKEFATDRDAYLINETLAKQLGWDDPLGKTIRRNGDRTVIGMVKDFQFATLHNKIEPLLITNTPWRKEFDYLSIKISTDDIPSTLGSIEKVYKQFSPLIPFEYFFLDDAFDRLYKSEERFEKIFQYFSLLAICIALLGLFSLTAYSAQQKSKEIGIRKVLGATVPQILSLFSRETIVLILSANVLACPFALIVIQRWLGNFAYRSSISVWSFVMAFFGSMAAAFVTISYQSLKAALKKPADELRSE
jgi:putative ABC transport system permease protein